MTDPDSDWPPGTVAKVIDREREILRLPHRAVSRPYAVRMSVQPYPEDQARRFTRSRTAIPLQTPAP
jgi:hypothetical protein